MNNKDIDDNKPGALFREITTDRLLLRNPRMEDTQRIYDLYKQEKVWKFLIFDGKDLTFEKEQLYIAKFIEENGRKSRRKFWFIEHDGRCIGSVGLHAERLRNPFQAEIGYWLDPEYWGRGIMTEACRGVVGYCFGCEMNLTSLLIRLMDPNAASGRVAEKCGFTFDGVHRKGFFKNGIEYDSHIWTLLKSEWTAQ